MIQKATFEWFIMIGLSSKIEGASSKCYKLKKEYYILFTEDLK